MPFDVAGARKAGFRDDEILNVAAKELGISESNLTSAREKYSDKDILDALKSGATLPEPSSQALYAKGSEELSAATRFGKVMENLSRPNYMMAQGVNAAIEGEPVIPAMGKGWSLEEPMVFGDVIQSQMEKRAPAFVSENPSITAAISTLGGLTSDVVLDPTTYTPGILGKTWKAAKYIPGVEGLAKAGRAKTKEFILGNAIVSDVGRLFTNKVGSKAHRDAYDILKKYEDLQGYRSQVAVKEMVELDKQIVKLAKDTGEDLAVLRGKIIDSVEKRLISDNPTINDVVDSLVSRNAEQLRLEQEAGLRTKGFTPKSKQLGVPLTPEGYAKEAALLDSKTPVKYVGDQMGFPMFQQENGVGSFIKKPDETVREAFARAQKKFGIEPEPTVKDYFVHALSNDGKKWLEKNGGSGFKGISKNMTDTHASMIQRKYGDMSIREVNDMMRTKGLKGDFFLVDPARAQAIRDIRSARAITGAEFYDEMAKTFGVDTVSDGAQQLIKTGPGRYNFVKEGVNQTELIPVKPPRLKGKLFPPEVASVIDKHYERFTNPEEVNTVLRTYDSVQNWWKSWTLGIFPAYHARNMAGNIWNNSLADVRNPIVYKIAADIQRGKGGILKTAFGDMEYKDVIKLAGERGVIGKGFYGGDIPKAVDDLLVKGKWNTLGVDNKVVKTGRNVGATIEDNARLAHFVDKLRKGMDADSAAKSVKKFLFDYTELTSAEQNLFKRVFPFYSWSRKNIPLQLEMMVRKPGQQLIPVKLKHEIERGSKEDRPIPEANLPEWLVGDYPIRTSGRHKDESDQRKNVFSYTPVAGYLPWGDLPRWGNNPQGTAAFMVSPLLKEPLQQGVNYDLYFKGKIANPELPQGTIIPKEGEEFTRFMGVKLTPRAAHVARNIRLLATLHRANPFQVFGESTSDLGTGEKMSQYILGVRTYDVDEIDSMVKGLYSEKRKIVALEKDLYILSRELSKAREQGKNRAAIDAQERIKTITDAIGRISKEEVKKHIP